MSVYQLIHFVKVIEAYKTHTHINIQRVMRMRIVKVGISLTIENEHFEDVDTKYGKLGQLFPPSIRCIIAGLSNCGKTNVWINLIEHGNALKFGNVYVYSKSSGEPKCIYLEQLLKPIQGIDYFAFSDSEIIIPSKSKQISLFIFVTLYATSRLKSRIFQYVSNNQLDSFYLIQSYDKFPKHLVRDNANPQKFTGNDLNLKHAFNDHVGTDIPFMISRLYVLSIETHSMDSYVFLRIVIREMTETDQDSINIYISNKLQICYL